MPRMSPYLVQLTEVEREALLARARRYTSPYRDVIRAKIVLLAALGLANDVIAARLDTPRQIVSKWRKRFCAERLPGLEEQPRGGRPPAFPPSVVVEVKALACELPARRGRPAGALVAGRVAAGSVGPRARGADQRRHAVALAQPGRAPALAPSQLDLPARSRVRRQGGPDPGSVRTALAGGAARAPGLRPVRRREDQHPSPARRHPTLPPRPGRPMHVEHEYERGGAWAYLAAWDVHRAKVFGRCEPKTGIAPFDRLVAQVMSQEPYRSARRVFWIVDNGSAHRGQPAVARLQARWPQATLVHTPVHASWLNQIEIYFSIVQRKVLTPNDFRSLAAVKDRLLHFQVHYADTATPFQWTFTRRDLHASWPSSRTDRRMPHDAAQIRHRNCEREYLASGRWPVASGSNPNPAALAIEDLKRSGYRPLHPCPAAP